MSRKHSCMTTEPRSRFIFAGSAGLVPGVVAIARSQRILTLRRQGVVRGLRRDGCMGALGRPARSLAAKCQTNFVLSVRSAILPGGETERQRSVASGKWPCSRLLPMSWPGEASRPTTVSSATGGASRRIAVSCPCEASRAIAGSCRAEPRDILLVFPGCARSEAGLASLRPSEHSETLRVGARRTGVHRSGLVQRSGAVCKAGESGQGAGGTVPILAPNAFGEASAL